VIYLDAAATTPVRREALEAMWPLLTSEFGNPSSRHGFGDAAARALAQARGALARLLGVTDSGVVLTSGGTEAANLAIKGIALAEPRGRHVIVSAVEHEAVLESADYLARHHGFAVDVLGVDRAGRVQPERLAEALRDDTTLVSVQYANNEVGTIQPVAELARVARARGARLHTDAVQAAGWLPLDASALGVDAISVSGHKFGAPKGTGALAVRAGVRLEPLLHGGGQERGARSGTENVAGAVALAVAAGLAERERADGVERVTRLRDLLMDGVREISPDAIVTGDPRQRLPGIASFCFPGVNGEAVLLGLEEREVYTSSGSACAAGRTDPSHVLLAMGYPAEVAHTAVRFSLAHTTTEDDVAGALAALERTLASLGRLDTRARP